MSEEPGPSSGSSGPPTPVVRWEGTVRRDWVPGTAIAEYQEATTRLSRPWTCMIFFGGAALSTLPAIAPKDTPGWLVLLLIAEVVAALVSAVVWLARRDRVTRARVLLAENTITEVQEYGSPPPTAREGPPPEQLQLAQAAQDPQVSGEPPPTRREGPTSSVSEQI